MKKILLLSLFIQFLYSGPISTLETANKLYYLGNSQDKKESYKLYNKAAKNGNVLAKAQLGKMLYYGYGVDENKNKAKKYISESMDGLIVKANKGNSFAQYLYGWYLDMGIGIKEDDKKAVYWYKKAAEQGYVVAQYNFANQYRYGEGVKQDYKKAVYWYKKAAEQGYMNAQRSLGYRYLNGTGVKKDDKKVFYWWKKAAEQGDSASQVNLGTRYQDGTGVKQDYKKAVYWYKKAAEQGNSIAEYQLGELYYTGKGVDENDHKAYIWYIKSAHQGHKEAQDRLGWMNYHGQGTWRDTITAVYWYEKAIAQGHKGSKVQLDKIYPEYLAAKEKKKKKKAKIIAAKKAEAAKKVQEAAKEKAKKIAAEKAIAAYKVETDKFLLKTIYHNGYEYRAVKSPATERIWLDRNIGADRVCQSFDDEKCYGGYFQWARNADGHEKKYSDTTENQATSISNVGNKFIVASRYHRDHTRNDWAHNIDQYIDKRRNVWRTTRGGICPAGFRVPDKYELESEDESAIDNKYDAFQSFLKLPLAGYRSTDGSYRDIGDMGSVWSSSDPYDYGGRYWYFSKSYSKVIGGSSTAIARQVRCILKTMHE